MTFGLLIRLQTLEDLTSWEVGAKLLSAVFANPKLTPQRIATFGEVSSSNGWDVEELADCREHWATRAVLNVNGVQSEFTQDFHWTRKKVAKSQGAITFAGAAVPRGARPFSRILFQSQYRPEIAWDELFRTWCEQTLPYTAILHPLVLQDGPNPGAPRGTRTRGASGLQPQAWSRYLGGEFHSEFRAGESNTLQSGLTNPGWASWFGGPYAQEVDVAALRSAGFPVAEIGSGYLVQLTARLDEVAGDFGLFSRRRAALKALFRPGLFMIESEP